MPILSLGLDLILIGLLVTGISYAIKLSKQLGDMRSSRADMERFVMNFNAIVSRAEAGIRGLKAASRETGDDLERLIEKGQALRDELHFLTDSADQIASRLTDNAAQATRAAQPKPAPAPKQQSTQAEKQIPLNKEQADFVPASAAERELLRALKKRG